MTVLLFSARLRVFKSVFLRQIFVTDRKAFIRISVAEILFDDHPLHLLIQAFRINGVVIHVAFVNFRHVCFALFLRHFHVLEMDNGRSARKIRKKTRGRRTRRLHPVHIGQEKEFFSVRMLFHVIDGAHAVKLDKLVRVIVICKAHPRRRDLFQGGLQIAQKVLILFQAVPAEISQTDVRRPEQPMFFDKRVRFLDDAVQTVVRAAHGKAVLFQGAGYILWIVRLDPRKLNRLVPCFADPLKHFAYFVVRICKHTHGVKLCR